MNLIKVHRFLSGFRDALWSEAAEPFPTPFWKIPSVRCDLADENIRRLHSGNCSQTAGPGHGIFVRVEYVSSGRVLNPVLALVENCHYLRLCIVRIKAAYMKKALFAHDHES